MQYASFIEFDGFIGDEGASVDSATVRALKAAADSASTTVVSIPHAAGITPTIGAENAAPDIAGGYQRYWLSGAGTNNASGGTTNPRLNTLVYIWNFESWAPVFGGGVNMGCNDGSAAEFWSCQSSDYESSIPQMGFIHTGRYLAVPTNVFCMIRLEVDGVLWPRTSYPNSNCYAVWDLGSVAARKIKLVGNNNTWFSEVVTGDGETLEPWNFFEDAGSLVAGFIGDSYMDFSDDTVTGLGFMEMMLQMVGGAAYIETSRGGTGWRSDNGEGEPWQGASPERIAVIGSRPLDLVSGQMGINDAWPGSAPTTTQAMITAVTAYRAQHPKAMIVMMGPWAPKESDATNPGGTYIAKMDAIIALMADIDGPWIVLDNIRGNWLTSTGKSNSVAIGPWQTGDGYVGSETGTGNGDTWVSSDGTHPTSPVGITGLSQLWAGQYREAIAAF